MVKPSPLVPNLCNMIFQKQLVKSLNANRQNTAIEYDGRAISYAGLQTDAHAVTQFLLHKKPEKETVIGIDLKDRSKMITAIMGVSNARCVFVLLDRSLPAARMDQLIAELDLKYVITDEDMHPSLESIESAEYWDYDKLVRGSDRQEDLDYPEPEGDDSLYVYFTSGSTGTPKGIVGKNSSLLQFLRWEIKALEVDTNSRFSQFISPYFDAFLRDVFTPLLAGGTLCIPPDEEDFFTAEKMTSWIDEARITTIHAVPSLFSIINTNTLSADHFKHLRHILLSGEKIVPSTLTSWYDLFQDRIQLFNLYGTTEATMVRSCYKIQPEDVHKARMPVGSPIDDTELLIAKKNMEPCSTLMPGDLYIVSEFLTKGYLNQPELTEERFIKLHEGTPEETVAYRTGDKARRLANGQIELLGREDRQIKLRGIRIELDEVEINLMASKLIDNAVVILHKEENSPESLVAFVKKKDHTVEDSETEAALADFMRARVPGYLIPSNTYIVKEYPLLSNGKVDMKGLLNLLEREHIMVMPATATEEKVLTIWKEVLGEKGISTDNSFQKAGGNSLALMSLIARINKAFSIRVSLSDLFLNNTIQKQATLLDNAGAGKEELQRIEPTAKADHYPLSSAQKRLFFLYQYEPNSLAYNMPNVFRLEGELDLEHFQRVFQNLIAHHGILRTFFVQKNEEPVQKVADKVDFQVEYHRANEEEAKSIIKEFIRPFDLSSPTQMRVGLIEVSLDVHLFMVDFHHIITDGVSQELLIKEFMALYDDKILPEPKLHYKDYAVWQQAEPEQERVQNRKAFWSEQFAGEFEPLDLPLDFARPVIKNHEGGGVDLSIDKAQSGALAAMAEEEGATLFMVMLSAYYILLTKLTNQEDIVVGTTVAGRQHEELEQLQGMFVNTLCLRNAPTGELNYREFLASLKANTLDCLENQDYPYEDLIDALQLERDTSRNPLFDVMFSYQNYKKTTLEFPELTLSPQSTNTGMAKFDMTLYVNEAEAGLELHLEYAKALFREETVRRFVGYYHRILTAITDNVDVRIADIEVLSEEEKNHLLIDFNDTRYSYGDESTVLQLFNKVVANHPDKTALVCGSQTMNYATLDKRSNQLAHCIKTRLPEEPRYVGILMERSPDLIVSMLAVMKSGHAYVPFDPDHPVSRIKYATEDGELALVLASPSTSEICSQLPEGLECLYVTSKEVNQAPEGTIGTIPAPESIVYVIYTSGSTGRPKGVKVSHGALHNYTAYSAEKLVGGAEGSFALYGSVAFDLNVTPIFTPLVTGDSIIIYESDKENAALIEDVLHHGEANFLKLTPTHLRLIKDLAHIPLKKTKLKGFIVGGEEFPYGLAKEIYDRFDGDVKIFNEYGPTEATVGCTIYPFDPEEELPVLPMGIPLDNMQIYLLDPYLKPVPTGVKGEIYIGGKGVAEGYINASELTDKKFIDNPFTPGEKMYRSGDLASINHKGQLIFYGRADHQVKLRGFRIELGEIGTQMAAFESVEEAVVLTKGSGVDQYLVGYYTGDGNIDQSALKDHLSQNLPAYMIPSYLIELDNFPLTSNGKLDRRALPEPDLVMEEVYVPAANETEEQLVGIWSEVLRLDKSRISVTRSFFELGGHSLRASVVVNKIRKELQVEVSLKDFFLNVNIRSLAGHILLQNRLSSSTIPKAPDQDHYVMSSAQKRQFFLKELDQDSVAYNMPRVLRLKGELDREKLQDAFNQLIARHETLRTSFEVIDQQPRQKVADDLVFELEYARADEEQLPSRISEFVRPFDLSSAPLMRVGLVQLASDEYIMLVDTHHIITDGLSQGVLIRDFMELYNGEQLPELTIHYKDYAEWQQSPEQQKAIAAQKDFWSGKCEEGTVLLDLPTDFARPKIKGYEGDAIRFDLSTTESEGVKSLAMREDATPFMIMLTIYNILLSKLCAEEQVTVGVSLAGRRHADVEKMIGMFANALPLSNQVNGEDSFRDLLQTIKSNAIAFFDNQDYPYEQILDDLDLERDTSRNPLFDHLFFYQNYQGRTLDIPGLEIEGLDSNHSVSNFDLALIMVETEEKTSVRFEYPTALFKRETVERFTHYFKRIINTILSGIDIKVKDIDLLSTSERDQQLTTFNDTRFSIPTDKTYVDLFVEQAQATPENIAISCAGNETSYRELDERSNELANTILKSKTASDAIGLFTEPTAEMLIGLLGILKAGKAFLPLDPRQPQPRLTDMLEDSACDMVVTTEVLADQLRFSGEKLIIDLNKKSIESERPLVRIGSHDLAYIIYTSGSTGKPKGVKISHGNLVNYALSFSQSLNLKDQDKSVLTSSYVFDLGYSSIFPPLISGAQVHLADRSLYLSPEDLLEYIGEHCVTYLKITPSLLRTLVNASNFGSTHLESVKHIVIGGEAIVLDDVTKVLRLYNQVTFIDEYGPTETTVGVIAESINDMEDLNALKTQPSIGKPIHNTKAFILDKHHRLVPVGVVGELCIAGASVGPGYTNNEALNRDKFIKLPIHPDGYIYRTGDLARYLPDGRIVFLGRADNQVKIRGYRIEPDEIANRLRMHDQVTDATVLVKGDEDKRLVAYYVVDVSLPGKQLKSFLSETLPEYMIPSDFVGLEAFPLTANGKLDARALPEPNEEPVIEAVAPISSEEELLVEVWSEVMKSENISTTDDFFSVGGDSIKCILICSKVRTRGYALTIQDVLTHRTIQNISKKLTKLVTESSQEEVKAKAPLTPIQAWFFDSQIQRKHHHNLSVMLEFNQGVSIESIQKIFNKIWSHHDALRTVFKKEDDRYIQQVMPADTPLSLEFQDLTETTDPSATLLKVADKIQSGIDLENGPLLKLGLFRMEKSARLLIVIHHLIIDGVSWRILFEDINSLYEQEIQGQPLSLPPKTSSFQSWAENIRAYTKTKVFQKANDYWDKTLSARQPASLRHFPKGEHITGKSKNVSLSLSKEITSKLLSDVHGRFHTQINDLLLAGFVLGIQETFDQKRIRIDLEGHGRENLDQGENVSRTVGWFTSIYPVWLECTEADLPGTIKGVKESLRSVPNNGIDYLIKQYGTDEYAVQDHPGSQIIFNYLGQFDSDIDDKAFKVSQELVGKERAPGEIDFYDWNLTGMITGGELKMNLGYSEEQYQEATIISFMADYKKYLIRLIEFCAEGEEQQFTPSDFTYKGLSIPQVDELNHMYDMMDLYGLSPMQEGMLFHALYDDGSEYYFEQMTCSIKGQLDPAVLEQSMNTLMDRYDILRTIFLHEGYERPIQVVLRERKVNFRFLDVREECSEGTIEEIKYDYKARQREEKFDLSNDVLMRMWVLQTADDQYELIWAYHHILMDGWCMGIITSELKRIYTATRRGNTLALPDTEPYSRYIQWLENRDKKEALDFWKRYLKGYGNQITLPKTDTPDAAEQPNDLKFGHLTVDKELTSSLDRISRDCGVTVNTIIQSAWGLLLGRYNDLDDVVFGSVVSGRPAEMEGMENMVGLFINTVPVRVTMEPESTVVEFLQSIQGLAVESKEYHYNPLSEIQATHELGSDLVNCVMVFENYPVADMITDTSSGSETTDEFVITDVQAYEPTNYDLIVFVVPGDEIRIRLDYNANVFSVETIENCLTHLNNILSEMASNVRLPLKDIQLLTGHEQQQVLYEFNDTTVAWPKGTETVLDAFRQQVKESPDSTALRYEAETMSYHELDDLSAKMATYLMGKERLKRGQLVALVMDRKPQLILSVLAILKAGAAYLPIEPANPEERRALLLTDSGASLVITEEDYVGSWIGDTKLIDMEATMPFIREQEALSADVNISKTDMAYMIYTSGSTGKPKGVRVSHGALYNYIQWSSKQYVSGKSSFALYSSMAFDLTITSIFTPLTTGNEIVIYQGDETHTSVIEEVLAKDEVEVIKLTPTHLKLIRDGELKPKNLKRLIVGGEALTSELAGEVQDKMGDNVEIFNEYGPTEATIGCMIHRFNVEKGSSTVPIGVPIDNTQVYVLDRFMWPVAKGVAGELYVSGAGLAMGYHNEEGLTQQSFVENPFIEGAIMYKTGDLAKLNNKGQLVYAGRTDDQVKIRGFRIELGEVESHIATHQQIKEVAVAVRSGARETPYLVAYYQSDQTLNAPDLVAHLEPLLPDYMIPGFYVKVDEFPVTVNGKLNRKALPEPEIEAGEYYIAPETPSEKRLLNIWVDILELEAGLISTNRSFFELGGHSLNSIALVNSIYREFGVKLLLKEIFARQTIKKISSLIDESVKSGYNVIPKAEQKEYYPLSQAQLPVFFQHELDPDSLVRNLTFTGNVEGELDKKKLESVFYELIARHDSLRTAFRMNDTEPVQMVQKTVDFEISQFDATHDEVDAFVKDFVRPFDISQAPLMRVGLIRLEPKRHVLIVDVNHLIADGLSLEILQSEFLALYNGMELPTPESQYADFVAWEESDDYQDTMMKQKQFWINEFAEKIQSLEVPLDYEAPDGVETAGESIPLELDSKKMQALKKLAEKQGATLSMVILAAYNILLSKLSRQEDIVVGVPFSGRERAELEQTVGMFAKVLPVRNYPKARLSFNEFLSQVKNKFSDALDNQTYPYEQMARELGIERSSGRNPWFDVMFAYHHQHLSTAGIEGLTIEEYDGVEVLTQQKLGLHITEHEDGLSLLFGYSKALFKRETVDKFIQYFQQIIDSVLDNADGPISQIEVVEGTDRKRLLFDFKGPQRAIDKEKVYSDLFKAQVERTPGNIAVEHNGSTLTYRQLYDKSVDLARYLSSKGINSVNKVAIYMPRGTDMLVSILATLQAGSAYVPIDVDYPAQRVTEIVRDSEVSMIITKAAQRGDLDELFGSTSSLESIFDIDELPLTRLTEESTPTISGTTNDLAYMIFTSGTTGKPKGVMIHQLGMINHLYAKIHDLGIDSSDVIAQTASPCFDISVWQFLAALIVGGKTYIIDKEKVVYPDSLCDELQKGEVSIFESVPSLMTNFLDDLPEDYDLSLKSLRWMVPTGEALSVSLAKKWYAHFPDIKLLNAYGPTEASDDVTHYVVPVPTDDEHNIPIGKPLANTHIFILNDHLGLCPVGVRGEICVAGLGVGKGYWHDEEKTREAFVPNPYVEELGDPDHGMLYKTGDIGYYREDGNVVYAGRKDDQLKINGNRVELGEIESRLSLHGAIKEAAVVAKGQDTSKYLAAYYVSDEPVEQSELRLYLMGQLPDYMVPAIYERLDKMPLTSNGKLDRKELPEPVITISEDFVKPNTVIEIKLSEIWADVLKIDNELVSVTADFFSLGGNSLMSITLVGKIHKALNVKISLREFFENPTVRATAEYIDTVSWLSQESKEGGKGKIEISI